MNRNQQLWSIVHITAILILVSALAASIWMPGERVLRFERDGISLFFSADRRMVFSEGDCIWIEWSVEGVREVYLNDQPTVGQGSARVCVSKDTLPTLRLVRLDGVEERQTLDIAFAIEAPVTYFFAALILAAALSGVLGALVLAAPRAQPIGAAGGRGSVGCTGRALQGIGALTLILAASALGLELALRLIFSTFGTEAQRASYLYTREQVAALDPYILALPLVEYALSPRREGHNRLGYRGGEIAIPKPEGTFRIVAMGGSTTYGFTPVDESYPAWLERTLQETYGYDRVEVINAGVHGYTSWNTLVNFATRIPELQPDLVIVYDGGNDVLPRETAPDCYRGINPLRGLDGRGEIVSNYNTGTFSPSALYRFIAIRLGIEGDPASLTSTSSSALVDCGSDNRTKADNVARNLPIYFERNLISLIGLSRIHDVPLIFSTWAFQQDAPGALPYWRAAVEEHNAVLRAVAAAYGIPLIDYAPLAPQTPDVWSDYVHMNSAGSRHQAEVYAEFIAQRGLIPAS